MNLKKIGLLVFILTFVAFSVFAQTTDEYVVVVFHLNIDNGWTFEFSNNRFTLAALALRDNSYAKALAQLLNYMYRNDYVVVFFEEEDRFSTVLFRRK